LFGLSFGLSAFVELVTLGSNLDNNVHDVDQGEQTEEGCKDPHKGNELANSESNC